MADEPKINDSTKQRTGNSNRPDDKPSVWESPWYWAHLFCMASLVGLVLVGPKFRERQAGFERKFQGRQRAAQQKAGQEPTTPLSTPENRYVELAPLFAALGVGAAISWFGLWRTHFRKRHHGGKHNEEP